MPGMMIPRPHQQSNAGRIPPKRQNRPTTANVDPMDPKGENYVERFIGHDRLQQQQKQQKQQQKQQQQQQSIIEPIEDMENKDSKWSKFETDFNDNVNDNTESNIKDEVKDDKWSKYETEIDNSQLEINDDSDNYNELSSNQQYEYETNDNSNDDKWSKWEAESSAEINAEEIMRRRFAVTQSSDISATIPNFNINVEELMRRRNLIPSNEEDDSQVGPSVGPAVPTESYEIFQSLQSLPTVEELLQQDNHNDDDIKVISTKPSNNGSLGGLLQYGSDDDDDDDNDNNNINNNNGDNNKESYTNTIPISSTEYTLNIPLQQVHVIEQKKPAPVKIKADSALTNFVPASLKMKRPNPNTNSSNPIKKSTHVIVEETNTTAIKINNNNDNNSNNNKEDDYTKFLAEISGL